MIWDANLRKKLQETVNPGNSTRGCQAERNRSAAERKSRGVEPALLYRLWKHSCPVRNATAADGSLSQNFPHLA